MQALLYANLTRSILASQINGSAHSWPKIVGGEDVTLKLRFCQDQEGTAILVQRTVSAIKASIGRQQISPESGTFTLKLGTDPEVAGENTTAKLDFDISAADLATALNALTDTALEDAQPFEVALVDGSYQIAAADRSAITFTAVDNELWPSSQVHIESRDFDEGAGYELRLVQAPVAQATTFNGVVPAIPTMTQVRAGATNSGVLTTELQRLFVPPENPVGFSFCLTRGYRKTAPIVIGDDNSADALSEKLNAVATATSSGFIDDGEEFIVYAAENGVVIEFAGTMAGTNQDTLGVAVIAEAEPDTTLTLATATPSMATLLRKVNETTKEIAAVLHLQIWLEDEQDAEIDREFNFHIPITLIAPVNMESLIASAEINWATPLSRESYLQHSPTQVATGQRHYLIPAFGDTSAVEFTITHDLGTRYVLVAVQENTPTGQFKQHGTDYEIEIVSDNAIKLIFGVAPDTNEFIGQITSAAHDANFEPHTHEIDEITGLEARLTGIEEAVAELQESSAVGSGGTRDPAAGSTIMEQVFRTFREAYPMATTLDMSIASIAAIDQKTLPGDSDLLGAIHDAAAASLASPAPTPSASNKGMVYQNRSLTERRLNGGGNRSSYKLQPGEFCGSDGRRLYPLILPGVHNGIIAFTVNTSTNVVSTPGFTLVDGTEVLFLTTDTLPAPISNPLYVINAAAGSCKLSSSIGGAEIDITTSGTGTHYLYASAGAVTSFFPRDFEREIFVAHVSPNQLLVNKTLEAKVGFETAILSVGTPATRFGQKITQGRWRFIIEVGHADIETLPVTTKSNLRRIIWTTTPVLDELVYLTRDTAAVHTFGARIKRTAADAWTVEKCIQGFWAASNATLADSDFFIRARLTEWDVEDIADPEGVVILLGPDKTNPGDKSNMGKLLIK